MEELREEQEEGAAFVGVHAGEEEDDVFLPLSPSSAAPYTVKFSNGTTPSTPHFPRGPEGEHARKHSRIHERNLSAFFPRPGQQATGYGDTYDDPNGSGRMGGISEIPPASSSGGFPQVGNWGGLGTAPAEDDAEDPAKSKDRRRGHHHRHSLSHNFFSFLDPTETNPGLPQFPYARTSLSHASYPPNPIASSTTTFLPAPSLRSKYSHLPAPIRLFVFSLLYLPLGTKLALALSAAQIVIGAMLWVQGQSGESLAVTGLGYLVVFDGMGGLSGVFVEGGAGIDLLWSLLSGSQQDQSVRMPFGLALDLAEYEDAADSVALQFAEASHSFALLSGHLPPFLGRLRPQGVGRARTTPSWPSGGRRCAWSWTRWDGTRCRWILEHLARRGSRVRRSSSRYER